MAGTTWKIMKYAALPGFVPRILGLFSQGFSRAAFFMALVFGSVRLLPPDHAYLNPANAGRYGLTHVIFEAGRRLSFKKENADQIAIYFILLSGFILLFAQFFLFILSLAASPALAGDIGSFFRSFFVVEDPTYDLAFILLERTFGLSGIYGSCIDQGVACRLDVTTGAATGAVETIPGSFHNGLHKLFEFYNTGILVIGVVILLYFTVVIVTETAHDGTPFGRRFNHAWAPVRLFLAIGLLTPLNSGFNGAQLATFYVAKWGSNVASNAWKTFTQNIDDWTPMGKREDLVALPGAPTINVVPEFMFVARTCKSYYEALYPGMRIGGWIVGGKGPDKIQFEAADFSEAREFAVFTVKTNDIYIRFGESNIVDYENQAGNVRPFCGEIAIPVRDMEEPGARIMQSAYYYMIQSMWMSTSSDYFGQRAENVMKRFITNELKDKDAAPVPDEIFVRDVMLALRCAFKPDTACPASNDLITTLQSQLGVGGGGGGIVATAREMQINDGRWVDDYTKLGWGGAAIWYNKIAQMNGSFIGSVFGAPAPRSYPEVMERVQKQRRETDKTLETRTRFDPILSNGQPVNFERDEDIAIAKAFYAAQSYWPASYTPPTGNVLIDSIVAVFGLQGLYNIRDNLETSPLAQLVALGKGLIESAIANMGFAFAAGVMGGLANILNVGLVNTVGMAAASIAVKIGMMGFMMGFILFYIIPFLPFIYFFFALGGWLKAIFEAMIAMPLWALAHVRIDGQGIPGPKGMSGYYLLFEIFLRPTLIIFGLVGGVIIFTAQVLILNTIWELVTSNLVGFDNVNAGKTGVPGPSGSATVKVGIVEYARGFSDQFFHTIVYTIVVYLMAMSSFKLIDIVPNNILQWMNSHDRPTTEQEADPAGQLVQYAFGGMTAIADQMQGGLTSLSSRSKK